MSNQFWNQKTVMPKRKFRWLLFWTGVPQFVVKSVKRPSYSVSTTAHQFLNYEFNYPGRVTWEDVTITLVDPVTPDSTMSLYHMLERSGYVIPSNYKEAAAATISKKKMVTALGDEIRLKMLSDTGKDEDALETWVLKNPLITGVDFDELDYSSEDMLNISVTIKYDWAYIEELDSQVNENGVVSTQRTGLWEMNKYSGDDTAPADPDG